MDSQSRLFAFLIFTNLSIFILADDDRWRCSDSGNYTLNSNYSNNLNSLLSSLSSNMGDSGFGNASLGQGADQIYGIALCRADSQLSNCRTCVQNASEILVTKCPYSKQGLLWAEKCLVRYSNVSFLGQLDGTGPVQLYSMNIATSPDQFNENLSTLLGNLRTQAASGGSLMKVAADSTVGPNFQNIYALLQCTPDLSQEDCKNCLMGCTNSLHNCCDNTTRRGVRILLPSCNLRYEGDPDPFYNLTRIQEAQRISRPQGKGNNNNGTTVIIIVVTVVSCVVLVVFLGMWMTKRRKKKQKEALARDDDEMYSRESLRYDFDKIREATNNFSDVNKLGEGGFGVVYKGKLEDGEEIAVKRLDRGSAQGLEEFQNEVILLAKLQHRNLVRLIGFAQEGIEKLLIYEFIQNASLDHFIFDPIKASGIGWITRSQIIRGIARGLLYLHEDSRLRIIHRDLKPNNILLDVNMNPKITDFGTARLCEQDESELNTRRIAGTWGYMAPEYVTCGQFSSKSDVFSFGIVVLEIISGQKNSNFQNSNDTVEESLVNFVWRNWHEGTTINVIDPILKSSPASMNEIMRYVHIALLCVQHNAIDRPTMTLVVLMLNSVTVTLPLPSRPAFLVSETKEESSKLDDAGLLQPIPLSRNDISISDFVPR